MRSPPFSKTTTQIIATYYDSASVPIRRSGRLYAPVDNDDPHRNCRTAQRDFFTFRRAGGAVWPGEDTHCRRPITLVAAGVCPALVPIIAKPWRNWRLDMRDYLTTRPAHQRAAHRNSYRHQFWPTGCRGHRSAKVPLRCLG